MINKLENEKNVLNLELLRKDNILERINQNDTLLREKLKDHDNFDSNKVNDMINFLEYENSKYKVELDE